MGAALPMALGMELAHPELARKIVAVEGDSTFLHSGMTGLLDLVYNGSTALVMILDNSITAMTGHQPNPASGSHLDNSQAPQVNLPNLCKALGVPRVRTVDPYDLKELENAVRQELEATELSVIVVERPCVLLPQVPKGRHSVNPEACRGCTLCTRIGCPALSFSDKKSSIVPELCVGCGVCQQLCNFGAINKEV
ncbi:MAG: thiamine pyrophosphate-dependent enzyme, partial [Symbiobacteriaceae bacterium]|nr:thiamine pyrophosphate-dependent enzyme [Symbiobacteriaceae bacterium]